MLNECQPRTEARPFDRDRTARRRAILELSALSAGDTVRVSTANSEYRIEILDPQAGRAIIAGGSRFQEPASVEILGACEGQGYPLEKGCICVGRGMLLLHSGAWVRTSGIRSMRLED